MGGVKKLKNHEYHFSEERREEMDTGKQRALSIGKVYLQVMIWIYRK